eukprot:1899878-Prymnesium_polylepis.1
MGSLALLFFSSALNPVPTAPLQTTLGSSRGLGLRRSTPPLCQEVATADPKGQTVITCGQCKATYPIDVDSFGSGKQVRCSNCKHEWFQSAVRLHTLPGDMELVPYPAAMKARIDAGKSPEPRARYRAFVGNLPFTATEE